MPCERQGNPAPKPPAVRKPCPASPPTATNVAGFPPGVATEIPVSRRCPSRHRAPAHPVHANPDAGRKKLHGAHSFPIARRELVLARNDTLWETPHCEADLPQKQIRSPL